jgi:hypothetical protein
LKGEFPKGRSSDLYAKHFARNWNLENLNGKKGLNMELAQFDLEAFRRGRVALLRNGKEVRFIREICQPEIPERYRLFVEILGETTSACTVYPLTPEGKMWDSPSPFDIIGMEPEKRIYYFNVYLGRYNNTAYCGGLQKDKETCVKFASNVKHGRENDQVLAIAIPIEWNRPESAWSPHETL